MKISAYTQFANMNVRAEKSGEDVGEGAVDLTFEATLGLEDTALLFSTAANAARLWLAALYADKGQGDEVAVPGVSQIKLVSEFDPVKVEFKPEFMDPMEMERCRLDKVVVTPEYAQRCSVKFRIQGHPTAEQVGNLYEMQGRDLNLSVFKQQGELPFGEEEQEAETEGAES